MILAITAIAAAAQPVKVEALSHDRKGRPTIAATIDGKGPYPMVVDTGAQTTLLSPDLAEELDLPEVKSGLTVSGVSGGDAARLAGVDSLSTDLFDLRDVALPLLPNASATDARGIIGMDEFSGRKLVFDEDAAKLELEASAPAPAGWTTIEGAIDAPGFLMVPMTMDGKSVQALVDTGSQGVIADRSLLDLLGWSDDDPRLKAAGTMRGSGTATSMVRSATMDTVSLGPIILRDVPVIIAPQPLRRHGDQAVPQIILGSNILKLLSGYAVDLGRGELQIRIPVAH